ncbi:MAG TPA: hypothetical protein VF045_04225 [Acidimicrobiales bacterium]
MATTVTFRPSPAGAFTLGVTVVRIADGTAQFPNWDPAVDTFTPSQSCPAVSPLDPGDDCGPTNDRVRTLDESEFEVQLNVNADPNETVSPTLTVSVSNGVRFSERFTVPVGSTGICTAGSVVFDAARTTFTCTMNTFNDISANLRLPVFVVAPMTVAEGTTFDVTATMTEGATTETDTYGPVTVTAAPRYELVKQVWTASHDEPGPAGTGGRRGFLQQWVIGIRGGALDVNGNPDPRGLSALPATIALSDIVQATPASVPVWAHSCDASTTRSGWPQLVPPTTVTLADPASQLRRATIGAGDCPSGIVSGPTTITVSNIDWTRAADLPVNATGGGALPTSRTGLVAYFTFNTWTANDDMDAAEGAAGDGVGRVLVCNSVETANGGTGDPGGIAGPISFPTWSPSGAPTWHPVDRFGSPNLSGNSEPIDNNGACAFGSFAPSPPGPPAGGAYKVRDFPEHGEGVPAGSITRSRLGFQNTSATVAFPAGVVLCDKWDSSRFSPANPIFLESIGNYPGPVRIEYGTGNWGSAASPPDSVRWANQASARCEDSDLLPGRSWTVDPNTTTGPPFGATVAFPAGLPADVNMMRITALGPHPGGTNLDFLVHWQMPNVPPGVVGDEFRNYSAFFLPHTQTFETSTCAGPNGGPCGPGLRRRELAGLRSHWWTLIGGTVEVQKDLIDPGFTYAPGSTTTWRIQAGGRPFQGATTVPLGRTTAVTLVDVLPPGFDYVPGSTTVLPEPTCVPDTPSAGFTTCTWVVGDLDWSPSGTFTLDFNFDVLISPFVTAGTYPNVVRAATPDDPTPYAQVIGDDRRIDDATVMVGTATQVGINKSVTPLQPLPGGSLTFTLRYGNPTGRDVISMDAVDLLPFDGDPRGSVIAAGSLTLTGVTSSRGEAIWVSSEDPQTLDAVVSPPPDGFVDPANAGTLARPRWCPLADVGDATACPEIGAIGDVTAVRIVGSGTAATPFLPAGSGPFEIGLTFDVGLGARVGDTYVNSWMARFEGFVFPLSFEAFAATVTTAGPALAVAKEVRDSEGNWVESTTVPLGGPAEWRITVTNTGGTTLSGFTFDDPLLAGCEDSGAAAAPATLGPGGSFVFQCTDPEVEAGYTNVITVDAVDPAGNIVDDSDDAQVVVGPPGTTSPTTPTTPGPVTPARPTPGLLSLTGGDLDETVKQAMLALATGLALVAVGSRRRQAHREFLQWVGRADMDALLRFARDVSAPPRRPPAVKRGLRPRR